MRDVCVAAAVATALATGISGLIGVFQWWAVKPTGWGWLLLRAGQLVAVGQAAVAGIRYAVGPPPDDSLYYLYATLPVAVAFVAEQLRLAAAEQVLEDRDLDGSAAVRLLPEAEQMSVMTAIVRRELGAVAAAALVASFLALRAWGTA